MLVKSYQHFSFFFHIVFKWFLSWDHFKSGLYIYGGKQQGKGKWILKLSYLGIALVKVDLLDPFDAVYQACHHIFMDHIVMDP